MTTTDRATDKLPPPQPPSHAFDWDEVGWREAGAALVELVAAASTGWDRRPPAPPATDGLRARYAGALPASATDLDDLVRELRQELLPASVYNGHPRFLAYITSSPLPAGVLADFAASALNQNAGLWRIAPAATAVELQTIDWAKEMIGYPADAEGVFVSGGQMANILAYNIFRDAKTPWDTRAHGMRGADGSAPRLRVYASTEVHYCHEQAAELLGMGREAVRLVPVDDAYRMRTDALASMIAEDRASGALPIAIAATAGTVGTGAIDPLDTLARVADAEDLWLHVDGAYGAFAALAPSAAAELGPLGRADSIACDPHKWLYAPIDAGVTLVRRPGLLEGSFAFHASYLATEERSGRVDMFERGPENSRRFRALKVWFALKLYGRDGFRDMIEHNIQLAAYMERLIEATPGLALRAPRGLSIVCWRAEPAGVSGSKRLDALQTAVIAELEARGIAVISNAKLRDGSTALRACIVNFRTTAEDVRTIVEESARIGQELATQI
jgi:glutamate/tyrosine decarboxylase-like PLP-dependent enzyme